MLYSYQLTAENTQKTETCKGKICHMNGYLCSMFFVDMTNFLSSVLM